MTKINDKKRIAELEEEIAEQTEILDNLELELRELQEKETTLDLSGLQWKRYNNDERSW